MKADREPDGTRWSFYRDLGDTRLVVIDSRAGRVLEPGARSMLDDAEWKWLEETATGGFDHLLLATSLPWLLMPALHDLEAWNEAVCDGAWGQPAAWAGEKVRQAVDLEHWAAFRESFTRLGELQRAVGAGERGDAAGHDPHPVRRRPPRLPGRGRRTSRAPASRAPSTRRSAPPSATRSTRRSAGRSARLMNPVDEGSARLLRRSAGVPEPRGALAPGGRRPLVRQPVRHPA